ncbi:hydantoinase/carbamoylase family amidase [Conexibacter sp. CPCC 206217]|uniref:hydantoinase/carbamoylase family amidase n=1 Tax=Conexibacter sp. CPCC 206217 TaxID=3064574 RepID=UPI0027249C7B|nr:hydantoinase/carbamoylase family amidase [Conexibacter sp. CPCC 206217]MDO8210249.1 hydantoinase/carbamoylase family amidase [Conexibacter sp. CPCC 206217]
MTPPERLVDHVDGWRVVRDLRVLARATSSRSGAQRVAWTKPWSDARDWLRERLSGLPVAIDRDEAGNVWAELTGPPGAPVVAVGSHLDSVPDGGWLDGALGVVAGVELLRAACVSRWDGATLRLVDWADEEGARFGHSLLGSSAATGLLDATAAARLRDRDGVTLAVAVRKLGLDVTTMHRSAARVADLDAFLELHIEQGPVLERAGAALAAPAGSVAISRRRFVFSGAAGHAGTTPLEARRDAGAAAARLLLAVREVARDHGGLATCGTLALSPGVATAVAAGAALMLDERHALDERLAAMVEDSSAVAREIAADEGVELVVEPVWSFPAVSFDASLVAAAVRAAAAEAPVAADVELVSGALHDAVALARAGVPVSMLFVRSRAGVSHSPAEDSHELDIVAGTRALAALADEAARRARFRSRA